MTKVSVYAYMPAFYCIPRKQPYIFVTWQQVIHVVVCVIRTIYRDVSETFHTCAVELHGGISHGTWYVYDVAQFSISQDLVIRSRFYGQHL